jgi:DNA polymerase-3 subunit delta'
MFSRLIGNERAQETLRRMLVNRRVPGALLFAGEDGVGKKLFALELAKALNCRVRVNEVEACDHCSSCQRISQFPNVTSEEADADKIILWSAHRDVGLARAVKRNIPVDLIRELERESNFRPFEGAARVFIIEGADQLNEAASNALLKTLEEPHPTSHLILLTPRPASLLPTIRSRCQTIRFAPLTAEEIEKYLIRERKRAGEEARLASHLARGRLGRALELNLDKYRVERETMLGILDALSSSMPDRARLLRAAEDLSDAKRKDDYEPRLDVLETLIHDLWVLTLDARASKIVNEDMRERLNRLSANVESRHAARWLSRIEELRRQLAVNINRRVATDALLLGMLEER